MSQRTELHRCIRNIIQERNGRRQHAGIIRKNKNDQQASAEHGSHQLQKMAEVLKDVIKANIYIVSSEGELLGYSILDGFECELMIKRSLTLAVFLKIM